MSETSVLEGARVWVVKALHVNAADHVVMPPHLHRSILIIYSHHCILFWEGENYYLTVYRLIDRHTDRLTD